MTASIVPERVLVVLAHPDDVDYDAAGTVAGLTAAGAHVAYCIVTYGDAGGFDETPRGDVPGLREDEQRAAAAAVGVEDITFLGHPDGRLAVTYGLRRDIARQVRRVRPQLVITSSPEHNYRRVTASHPDHLAVGAATLAAVYPDARNPFAHPELADLPAWSVPEVWLTGGPSDDHWVDVTATFDRKLAALRAHASQVPHLDVDELLRGRAAGAAAAGGLPAGRLAESFRVVDTTE